MNACPVCGSMSGSPPRARICLGLDAVFELVECALCGCFFCDPLPTGEQLARCYSASYYDFDPRREEGKGMAFARRLSRIRGAGAILDVGCAAGFFINGIKMRSQWEVYGIDFGESAVRYAREELNLNVRCGELAEADYPARSFDYIHVNNVLEHVRDPVGLLAACKRMLKHDGILHLSVPNGANDVLGLLEFHRQEDRPAFSHKGHICFFPARTLLRMIEAAGFTAVRARTHGFKRGMRNAGILPKKRNWKASHEPRNPAPGGAPGEDGGRISPPVGRAHSELYYRWRLSMDYLKMAPGLHRFGLDFLLLLKHSGSAQDVSA
ncbi:MAG: class I SAM-dependent methyltransferase [Chitinivibrionia bacterium]|nr:class I SAM-dependent methyltransferase [Chitinivibrionia bacterium]